MKAFVLAAGRGERMGALTAAQPKPLLPVAGQPLLFYTLENLRSAGFRDLIINVAYLGDQIQAAVGDGSRWGLNIVYSVEPYPLETGGAINFALPLLGDAPFLMVNADVWTDFPFAQLKARALGATSGNKDFGHLVLVPNPVEKTLSDFGLVGEQLTRTQASDGYTFSGISVLQPALIAEYPHKREKFPLLEALLPAIAQQGLTGELYRGEWRDIGTPERLAQLQHDRMRGATIELGKH